MHILLDARKLGDGGIGVYLQNLIDGLLALRRSGEVSFELSLLVGPAQKASQSDSSGVRYIEERAGKYSLAEYLLLARRHRNLITPETLYHAPHYTLPFGLGCRSVVTIHDTIHLSHPSRMLNPLLAQPMIGSALRRADRVITVSEFSRGELRRNFPKVRARIEVVANGCQAAFREKLDERRVAEVRLRHGVSAPYCLFVGNAKRHKGGAELLEAWRLLGFEFGDSRPQLVIVGGDFANRFRAEAGAACGERGVRFLSGLATADLVALTQGAVASLLPSRIEGFGLPALEALAMGTPVVCSPAPAIRELCEQNAWYAENFSARAFADAVAKVIRDPHGAALKAERGRQRSAAFTAERMARETWAVYCSAMGVAAGAARPLREGML